MRLLLAVAMLAAPLPAAGPWVVEFHESQCIAERKFRQADGQDARLFLKAPITRGIVEIGFMRPKAKAPTEQVSALFKAGSYLNAEQRAVRYLRNGQQVDRLPLSPAATAALGQADEVRWDGQTYAVGTLMPLLATLENCRETLRADWNYDPFNAGAGKPAPGPRWQPPKGSLVGLFSSSDYPALAIFAKEQGTVGLVLLVDEKGKIVDCSSSAATASPQLIMQTCWVITNRGRMEPARDDQGRPVRAAIVPPRVSWAIAD